MSRPSLSALMPAEPSGPPSWGADDSRRNQLLAAPNNSALVQSRTATNLEDIGSQYIPVLISELNENDQNQQLVETCYSKKFAMAMAKKLPPDDPRPRWFPYPPSKFLVWRARWRCHFSLLPQPACHGCGSPSAPPPTWRAAAPDHGTKSQELWLLDGSESSPGVSQQPTGTIIPMPAVFPIKSTGLMEQISILLLG